MTKQASYDDDDIQQRAKSTTAFRIVNEFDFFDEKRSGAKHIYILPPLEAPLKQIIFPQILNPPPDDDGDDDDYDDDDDDDDYDDDDYDDEAMDIDTRSTTTDSSSRGATPPRFLVRIMQEHEAVLLFEKKLELSDVAEEQNEVVISGGERVMAALTEEERGRVEREGFIEVSTMDPRENEYSMSMRLKNMDMGEVGLCLGHEWFKLVSANQLEEGDSVQGWGYRTHNNHFRFAIAYVRNLILT